jgi:hypothetical protein
MAAGLLEKTPTWFKAGAKWPPIDALKGLLKGLLKGSLKG